MTGPEHYRESERLIKESAKLYPGQERTECLALAQVHATLAHTAATVSGSLGEILVSELTHAWSAVTGDSR